MSIIDDLKVKKQKLTDSLNAAIDEATYDKIDAELRAVSKSLTLAENQERARIAAEAASKRKAEVDGFNAEKNRLLKAKKDADAMDAGLFEQIQGIYDKFSTAYDLRMSIAMDTKALQLRAEELGLEVPPDVPLAICNFSDSMGDKRQFFSDMLAQYSKAIGSLYGAHKRKEKAPDKPGMDWYYLGHGQFVNGPQQG